MTYANGAYTAQSGKSTISGGRVVLPSWVPPKGFFADVPMTNSQSDVTPALYGPGSLEYSFTDWGSSAFLSDFSPMGAQVYYGGGHEGNNGNTHIQMSVICDYSTLTWSVCNLPLQANTRGSFFLATPRNGFAADGTAYVPHTYLGLQEFPKAWGGGSKGSIVSFFWAGTSEFPPAAVSVDISQKNNGYAMFVPNSADLNIGTDYPLSVIDRKRQGWWVSGPSKLLFVSKTGATSTYPALSEYIQDDSMVLLDSLDLLIQVAGGYDAGYLASQNYRTLYIRNLTTGAVTQSLTLGAVPQVEDGYYSHYAGDNNPYQCYHAPAKMGLQWVEELGCIVGIDTDATPPQVVKLTPPAASPDTGQWTWSVVPLQHWTAGDPNGSGALLKCFNAGGQNNGIWDKLRWIPTLHAFVYCVDAHSKPQVFQI